MGYEKTIESVYVEGHLEDGDVIVRKDNGKSCYRGVMKIPTGTTDCTFVQSCMASTISGLTSSINANTGNIQANTNDIANINNALSGNIHTHSNKSILDGITDLAGPNSYFGGDGLYHPITNMSGYYNTVMRNGITLPQQQVLEFDTSFTVTNTGGRTVVSVACCGGTGGGSTPPPTTDDYVSSGSYNSTSNRIELHRSEGGQVNIDMTNLISQVEGNDTFVASGSYDPATKILRLTRNDAVNVDISLSNLAITEHVVSVASQTSVPVAHNTGRRPNFVCVDSAGNQVIPGGIHYTDGNNATISFSPAFTGTVYYI